MSIFTALEISNDVKSPACADRLDDRIPGDVAFRFHALDKSIDVGFLQIGDQVDVVCGSWLAMNRAGE